MFEIKSCGTTIDIVPDKFQAYNIYDRCVGPSVCIYQYNKDGNKYVIASKIQCLPGNRDKKQLNSVLSSSSLSGSLTNQKAA